MPDIIDELTGGPDEEEAAEAESQEQEATGEEAEEPAAEEKTAEEEKTDHRVPVGALQEERARRQELQAEVREARDKMARMEAAFEQFQKRAQGEDKSADIPSYDDDPEGHFRARLERAERELAEARQDREKQHESRQSQDRETELLERYAASVRDFTNDHPDFAEAYHFLEQMRDEELKLLGFTDANERYNRLKYDEGQIVGKMMAEGKNPAEALYAYAKHRGYKADKADEDEDKLARLQDGARVATSLAGKKGQTAGGISLERLIELEGEEFDKAVNEAIKKGQLG